MNKNSNYKKDGYILLKNFFTKKYCNELKKYISNKLKPKIYVENSKIPLGYGNVLNQGPFKKISDNIELTNLLKKNISNDVKFNHLVANTKPAWIGPDFEWHQEIFNVDTYAPGAKKKDWKKFAQIFIPLDDQNVTNGGLKIIPKSHLEGILPYEDFVNSNLSHKRKVKIKTLEKLNKKYGVLDLDLKAGDVLIFNHLLVHSSPKNMTSKERISLVLQAQSFSMKKDDKVFQKATGFRRSFTIEQLNKRLTKLKEENMYSDFNKK